MDLHENSVRKHLEESIVALRKKLQGNQDYLLLQTLEDALVKYSVGKIKSSSPIQEVEKVEAYTGDVLEGKLREVRTRGERSIAYIKHKGHVVRSGEIAEAMIKYGLENIPRTELVTRISSAIGRLLKKEEIGVFDPDKNPLNRWYGLLDWFEDGKLKDDYRPKEKATS